MTNCPVCTKILKKGACDNTACLYYGHVIYEEKDNLAPTTYQINKDAESEECPVCLGAGWIGRLLPNGHSEVTCNPCNGKGYL